MLRGSIDQEVDFDAQLAGQGVGPLDGIYKAWHQLPVIPGTIVPGMSCRYVEKH